MRGDGLAVEDLMHYTCRRMTNHNDLIIPSSQEELLIIDNGCDITIISKNSFLIQHYTNTYFNVDGALINMNTNNLQLVNDCFTCVQLPNNKLAIFKLNNCLLDNDVTQRESLLQPHHARAFGIVIDDVARRHPGRDGKPGGQCIHVGTEKLPLHFDGWKCYFHIRKPS